MMSRAPTSVARPAWGTPQSKLVDGNEFLKLFLERDQLHSGEYQGSGASNGKTAETGEISKMTQNRGSNARSLEYKSRNGGINNQNEQHSDDNKQQVVKLVTSGSKIVFLEEYDDDDAVVDAVARDIDLQKEKKPTQAKNQQQHVDSVGDDFKVVAVSVSSSSQRASATNTTVRSYQHKEQRQSTSTIAPIKQVNKFIEKSTPFKHTSVHVNRQTSEQQQQSHHHHHHNHHKQQRKMQPSDKFTSTTSKPTLATTTATTTATTKAATKSTQRHESASTWRPMQALPYTNDEFINLSHKSELSIEEVEPLTMSQRQRGKKTHVSSSVATVASARVDILDSTDDSENSASTNIQNVLAAPLHTRMAATAPLYHAGSSNKTNSSHTVQNRLSSSMATLASQMTHNMTKSMSSGVEDKLLPFQTVIYHDTRNGEGHVPQSRSISYSSISQNVEDLHAWQRTGGILAEAQRNVSESLKVPGPGNTHTAIGETSEPAKFFSVPAKMYSEPSKFYSEPAKVYSEPSKVYGESEKFYSEPAKVYGEPSKFYSEPSKVYSEPAKIYSEPAKTYWTQTTSQPQLTSSTATSGSEYMPPSRRPAIVSRIAFGEAQTPASTTTTTTTTTPSTSSTPYRNHHSQYTQTRVHANQEEAHSNLNSPPRRVLFNLDRLPYDLLNAPEQSSTHPYEPNLASLSRGPISCFESELPLTASSSASAASTASAQTAVSSLTVTHQPQQQQLLLIQQRQHSSLSDQHSNQNAKGLPNRGEYLANFSKSSVK